MGTSECGRPAPLPGLLGFRFDGHQLAATREHVKQVDRAILDGLVGSEVDGKAIGLQVEIVFFDRIASVRPNGLLFPGDYASFFYDHSSLDQVEIEPDGNTGSKQGC